MEELTQFRQVLAEVKSKKTSSIDSLLEKLSAIFHKPEILVLLQGFSSYLPITYRARYANWVQESKYSNICIHFVVICAVIIDITMELMQASKMYRDGCLF